MKREKEKEDALGSLLVVVLADMHGWGQSADYMVT